MTIAELIEELSQYPDDLPVLLVVDYVSGRHYEIGSIDPDTDYIDLLPDFSDPYGV